MRLVFRAASVPLSVMLLAGCAARQARAPQPQPQTAAAQATRAAGPESLSEFIQKVRHLSANARPITRQQAVETLEARDPAIAAELLLVSARPTAAGYRTLAERYRQRGVLDAAHRYFNRAIAIDPRDATAYEGLARVWRDWGFPQLALGDAHRAMYYAPGSAGVRNTYGTILQALGLTEGARQAYELASRLDPKAAYALNNLCYLAFLEGRTDIAVDTCTRALNLDPTLTAARNNLALAFAAGGRLDLARMHFLDAGDAASGHYNTGIAHLASGDHHGALAAFDAASRARPTFHLARERARQIRARLRAEAVNVGARADRPSAAPHQ